MAREDPGLKTAGRKGRHLVENICNTKKTNRKRECISYYIYNKVRARKEAEGNAEKAALKNRDAEKQGTPKKQVALKNRRR